MLCLGFGEILKQFIYFCLFILLRNGVIHSTLLRKLNHTLHFRLLSKRDCFI
ncbi:hypothetical protein DsansV1_C17g0143661 [Dioscorea sansibarensis]